MIPLAMRSMANSVEAVIPWDNMNRKRILYYNKGPFHQYKCWSQAN